MSKIKFQVIHCSGEDPEYPAKELNNHSPHTRGWQSLRFCEYPQEIGLQLLTRGPREVAQLQILSHQSKIASKIEIYVGVGNDYHDASYQRLGHLSLDSNERSSYQARELKTVFLKQNAQFIRLLIHRCHQNKYNLFNQVGIVAINLLGKSSDGDEDDEYDEHDDVKVKQQRQKIPQDSVSAFDRIVNGEKDAKPTSDLSAELNLDAEVADKLKKLMTAKNKAVDMEDYILAKQIKNVENELKILGGRIAQIDVAKKQAVTMEDYDKAKELKDEMNDLRTEIEKMINEVDITALFPEEFKQQQTPPPSSRSNGQQFPTARSGMPTNRSSARRIEKLDSDDRDDQRLSRHNSSNTLRSDEKNDYDGGVSDERPIRGASVDGGNYYEGNVSEQERREREMDDNDGSLAYRDPSREALSELDQHFPPGQHPLEGLPNMLDLPSPEPLNASAEDMARSLGIARLLGEYRTMCLFSKHWALREAALIKTTLMLDNEFADSLLESMKAVANVVRLGTQDKFSQVYYSSLSLLSGMLDKLKFVKIARANFVPVAEPIILNLIEKLSDGSDRIRRSARKALETMAASSSVGSAALSSQAFKPFSLKQKNLWRPLLGRLQLIYDLVSQYGVDETQSSGLTVEKVLNYMKSHQAFAHQNGEVRDLAKEITVALQKQVGTEPLQQWLTLLRPKQLEEYTTAFMGSGGDLGRERENMRRSKDEWESEVRRSHNSVQHTPTGKVSTAAVRVENQEDSGGEDNGDEGNRFTTCSFCGKFNNSWDEDALDLHYWKECPLLCPCVACAQVVEVAGLPDHLLTECDLKDDFILCETTGLAIRRQEFNQWCNSSKCVPPPPAFMYCPLCLVTVKDSDDAWRQHLMYQCSRNARSRNIGNDDDGVN